ncbi:MAG TPA: SLBB domain-containing protein, partial [Candidatus Xenobia bacterium]
MRRVLFYLALLVSVLALPGLSWAQTPPPPTATPSAPSTPLMASEVSPTYVLRPGDDLVITFLGVQDPPYDVKLREDGGMYIPRVGDVHAAGHTILELKPILEKRLAKHLLHSQVEIGLRSTAPQYAMVFGEVTKPGQIEVAEGTSLVQGLSEAGGFTTGADTSEVTLVRNRQTLHVLLENSGDPPTVSPGDVIYVQKAGKVSVMGSVNTPAIITINGSSSTVWEAIMSAGGPKPEAAMTRIKLVRFGATTSADAQ